MLSFFLWQRDTSAYLRGLSCTVLRSSPIPPRRLTRCRWGVVPFGCSNICSMRPGGGDLDPHRPPGRWRGRRTVEETQMRLYDDPVEVRRGETEGPDQFLWRGRLWKVRAVLAHWVETGPWWQTARAAGRRRGAGGADRPARRARALAGRGRPGDPAALSPAGVLRRLRPLLQLVRRALAARRLRGLRAVPMMNPHLLPATTHSYLERSAASLQESITGPRRAHPLCLRPRRGAARRGRPAGGPRPARAARRGARRTPGCCWPRSPPSCPSGRGSSPPAPPSGRPPRPVDPGGHRARGRRPGPRRRPVPGRDRAGAGAGAPRQRRR